MEKIIRFTTKDTTSISLSPLQNWEGGVCVSGAERGAKG